MYGDSVYCDTSQNRKEPSPSLYLSPPPPVHRQEGPELPQYRKEPSPSMYLSPPPPEHRQNGPELPQYGKEPSPSMYLSPPPPEHPQNGPELSRNSPDQAFASMATIYDMPLPFDMPRKSEEPSHMPPPPMHTQDRLETQDEPGLRQKKPLLTPQDFVNLRSLTGEQKQAFKREFADRWTMLQLNPVGSLGYIEARNQLVEWSTLLRSRERKFHQRQQAEREQIQQPPHIPAKRRQESAPGAEPRKKQKLILRLNLKKVVEPEDSDEDVPLIQRNRQSPPLAELPSRPTPARVAVSVFIPFIKQESTDEGGWVADVAVENETTEVAVKREKTEDTDDEENTVTDEEESMTDDKENIMVTDKENIMVTDQENNTVADENGNIMVAEEDGNAENTRASDNIPDTEESGTVENTNNQDSELGGDGAETESPVFSWKLPDYELIPFTDNGGWEYAKVSIPGIVRHEIQLSPEHAPLELTLMENVLFPTHKRNHGSPDGVPDPDPKLSLLNFHTVSVLVIESFYTFKEDGIDPDSDDVFFAVSDKWRVGSQMNMKKFNSIRGIQEFCDIALDVIFWIKENGLPVEEQTGKPRQRRERSDKGIKRGPRTPNKEAKATDENTKAEKQKKQNGPNVNRLQARKPNKKEEDAKTTKKPAAKKVKSGRVEKKK